MRLQDCKTQNCYRVCKKECPKTVDLNKCRNFGVMSGMKIGKDSCSTTQTFCRGSTQVKLGARRGGFQVTLDQVGGLTAVSPDMQTHGSQQQSVDTFTQQSSLAVLHVKQAWQRLHLCP